MDTDTKSATLPAKLRWRPYANGTSKKNSTKIKKIDPPIPKAVAYKIRANQAYTSKSNHAVKVNLQWEEAETIESMSHGGHPHNHHQYQHRSYDSTSSRDVSPDAMSDTSHSSSSKGRAFSISSTSSSSNNSDNGDILTSAMHRAMASLPSPPPSKPLSTGLDLVGGATDLNFFKASITGLAIDNYDQNSVTLTPDNAYQIALNALFQSQATKPSTFHTAALMDVSLANNNANNTHASSAASLLGSSTIHDTLLSDPNRVLSNEELLGVSTIDELLASCGVLEDSTTALTTQLLTSQADSKSTLNPSPLNQLLDLNDTEATVRATTPCSNTFSPMAISNQSFETLLSQSAIPQSLPYSQHQQSPISPAATSTSSSPNMVDPFGSLAQALSAPFGYLSSSNSFAAAAPTAWPSLFPVFEEEIPMIADTASTVVTSAMPQRSEMATQTEEPYVAPLSPGSTASINNGSRRSTPSPLSTALGLSDEELDPDWLSFLDEASPLFNDADMPSPPPSGDESTSYPQKMPKTAEQRTKSTWGWGSAVPPAGHRGLPSVPSMTGIPGGSIGGGGLVKTLQGVGQQRTAKPKTIIPSETSSIEKESSMITKDANSTPLSNLASKANEKAENQSEDSWSGLIHMIKGLWSGNGGDNNCEK
ncbi:hypothetical protein FBU30_010857 [Linnemannia zychae]|nr:hypothetical protein FBU30_010857 [Linnemannia zychae]